MTLKFDPTSIRIGIIGLGYVGDEPDAAHRSRHRRRELSLARVSLMFLSKVRIWSSRISPFLPSKVTGTRTLGYPKFARRMAQHETNVTMPYTKFQARTNIASP